MAYNTNPGKQNIIASASQTAFNLNFKIFEATDIKVFQTPAGQSPDDVADLLVLVTDYTVTIDGDNGGTVTLTTGAGVNDTLVLKRDLPKDRTTVYVTQGDLLAATINTDQEYQTYLTADTALEILEAITLPESTVGVSTKLPAVIPLAYLRWAADGLSIENEDTIPQAVVDTSDNVLNANSWANENEDVPVKVYTNGVPAVRPGLVYSAKHHQLKSEGFKDGAEAKALTALSYATEPEDTPVNVFTSDGDGTFTATPQAGVFSSLHYATKSATFNPALYALLTGATFTGQVKGITPVAAEDLTRKDYVDTKLSSLIGALDVNNYFHAQDQKPTTTNAGSSVEGYQTRTLNTVLTNNISGASLSTNQITLPAGTYYVEASAPSIRSNQHKLSLRNVTDVSDLIIGTSEYTLSSDVTQTVSFIKGVFTLAGIKALDLRHYISALLAGNGLGVSTNNGQIEVYTDIKIWKVG